MIFILSEQDEISTDNTIEWLLSMKKSILRITTDSFWQLGCIEQSSKNIHCYWKYNKTYWYFNDIESVWFRRGYLQNIFYQLPEKTVTNWYVQYHLQNETNTLKDFINNILSKKKSLNHPDCYNMNKLIALQNAVEAGFEIPDSLITQNDEELKAFKTKHTKLISKPIQDCIMVEGRMYGHVCTITNELENKQFGFSLFQQEIPKRVELRVFYLDGKCFTAAIFPHKEEQSIDGRILERNDDKLKRIVPFQLPDEQQEKIKKFMELSDLNCGSLDIILTPDNRYVFLEVNPVGQFDYVSKICNYYLEREIANYLSA